MRIEPTVSEPIANGTAPAPTADPEPLEEPPLQASVFQGFRPGPVKAASRAGYDALLTRGVAIAEFAPTMMHVKAMTVDGIWSVVGTANLDNRSLELNDELVVGIHDPALASTLRQAFDADLRRSTSFDLDRWRARPLWRRAQERFWSLFGELF